MTIKEARKAIRNLAAQDRASGQSINWARDVNPRAAIDAWRTEAAQAGDLATVEAIDLLDAVGDACEEYQRAASALCNEIHNA